MAILRTAFLCFITAALSLSATSKARSKPRASVQKSTTQPLNSAALRRLSLRDRIAQLIVVGGYGDYLNSTSDEYKTLVHWIHDLRVGGMIVANRVRGGQVINAQPYEMAAFTNHLQRMAQTPLFIASDFEHGASMRVAETAKFPYFMAYGAAHDLDAVKEFGAATAREARALGVTWVFAPDADVNNNPDNPIINTRSFGEDPEEVAKGVSAFIDGAHSEPKNYVLVTAKHFPGHGDTGQDSHMQMVRLDQPKERLESVELVPFRAAIANGVDAIMTAHMAVPAFEPEPIPATLSNNILTKLLRDELKFRGITVTDAMDMQGVTSQFSQGEAAVRAIEAGADVLLMPLDPEACIKGILAAVKSRRITQRRIDESVAKLLAAKQWVGLYANRFVDLNRIADGIKDARLDTLAQRAADEAVTLVKDDKHMFPVADASGACLVILTEGRFSSRGQALLNTVVRRAPKMSTFLANPSMPDPELSAISTAMKDCQQSYIAAFITVAAYRGTVELEGGLTKFVNSIIQASPAVALISLGNPYLLKNFPTVSSYLATFSPSTSSEIAAAKAMLGEIRVQGKLPISIPGVASRGDGIQVTNLLTKASQ
jgi:beta-N-acetylhexosaminidase